MALEDVAERPDQTLPRGGRNARPRSGLEGATRRGDRQIDVRLVAGRNMGDHFFVSRVLDGEGLAAAGVDPFAVDQHLMFFRQKRRRGGAKRGPSDCYGH